jgi:hypothetical protein
MRQSKRELYRQIEELDDEHDEGPDRIDIHETVIATGWSPDSEDDDPDNKDDNKHAPGEVIREETTVVDL